MDSKIFFQGNDENTIAGKIALNFSLNPKKVYFFCGTFKEGGLKVLEEELVDSNSKLFIAIGIDKKNTTKIMLDSLLNYTKDIYVYNNNDIVEFDSSICIFEFQDKACVYSLPSNFSESGIINNNSLYFEMTYDLKSAEDKKVYKDILKQILNKIQVVNGKFQKLNSEIVDTLQEEKEIFTTKQYIHNVKSISELLGKDPVIKSENKKMTKDQIDDIYVSDIKIPKIDINDDELEIDDIDMSEIEADPIVAVEENIKKIDKKEEKEEKEIQSLNKEAIIDQKLLEDDGTPDFDENSTLDIAQLLFSKADLKLDVDDFKKQLKNEEDKYVQDEVIKVKKVNLNNISNFIFELPNKVKNKQNECVLKIPNYISNMIPKFFEISDNCKTIEEKDGIYKVRRVTLELVDVKNQNKYIDKEAEISHKVGQSYISIKSEMFNNIDYVELDIARIIKLDSEIYHIEIISSDIQEYKLWNKVCNQNFKATSRKYGMM